MTEHERELKDKTFQQYRDEKNNDAEATAFGRSLGHVEVGNGNEKKDEKGDKVKSVREQVAEKIAATFKIVDQTLKAAGITDPEATLKLRDLLAKDLSPYLVKEERAQISMMDVSTLGLTDDSKVRKFLQRHGIDLDKEYDLEYAKEIFREAIKFYDKEIAQEGSSTAKINKNLNKIRDANDIYNVFKTAAGHGQRQLTPQACAILRVAMVIDFMKKDPIISILPEVEHQLKSVVYKHVKKVGNSTVYDTSNPKKSSIPLVAAEMRVKTPNRVLMKLLHKPSNSTSEVLDHYGYRFETESALDALRLIYEMFFDRDTAVLPSMNIRINKTKQSLIDPRILIEALKDTKKAEKLFAHLSVDTINHADVESQPITGTDNPHSSKHYRAIHITVDFPVKAGGKTIFIPIEIQYVDKNAHKTNTDLAPHVSYVETQRQTVEKRLLGNNLHTDYHDTKGNGNGKNGH